MRTRLALVGLPPDASSKLILDCCCPSIIPYPESITPEGILIGETPSSRTPLAVVELIGLRKGLRVGVETLDVSS